MKRMISAMSALLLLLSLAACGGGEKIASAPSSVENATGDWQSQYDLGLRYLSEGNYEEAILAFSAAIEIDPKRAEAYVGRGDAYVVKAENTVDDLQAAYEAYQCAQQDYEQAAALGSADLEEKQKAVQAALERLAAELNASKLLQPLYAHLAAGDMEGAKSLMRQEDYQAMSAVLADDHFYYDEGGENGLAVYAKDLYYFGQWQSGQRSGHGLWVQAVFDADSDKESRIYDGQWADDMPNGSGQIVTVTYPDKLTLKPGTTVPIHKEEKGTFLNGVYDGTFHSTWNMNDGETLAWSPILYVNGISQPMANQPQGILNRDYAQERLAQGEYLIATATESDLWGSASYTYTVFGF